MLPALLTFCAALCACFSYSTADVERFEPERTTVVGNSVSVRVSSKILL